MTRLQELLLCWRFALREMRSGLKGFYIFLACIALGVASIGGINGISNNISHEITQQGQIILAGDMRFSSTQSEANEKEMSFLKKTGNVSTSIQLRSMARRIDTGDQTLVEIKAVDGVYPLYGTLKTTPQIKTSDLFAKIGSNYGAVVPQLLLDRLQLHVGDTINIGNGHLIIRAVLDDEPDLLSEGFQLGPRVFMSLDALQATGLLQPGSLRTFVYKLAIPDASDKNLKALAKESKNAIFDSGWTIRTRLQAAPALTSDVERFSSFLTLIGLTALIVGGVGIANAVRSYMDKKQSVIATFKALGASRRMIFAIYFSQIMLIAFIGIIFGLVIAVILPFIVNAVMRLYLPFFNETHIYPSGLVTSIVFALLTTAVFSILPLAKSYSTPVTSLLRPFRKSTRKFQEKRAWFSIILLFIVIILLAFFTAYDRRLAVIFMAVTMVIFVILNGLAFLIQYFAKKCSHIRSTTLRLAVTNIYRPAALTPSVVMALGLGLTLLMVLATIDGNLRNQLSHSVSEKAPDFFFMDITKNDVEAFSNFIKSYDPDGKIDIMPTLRARIVKLNNIAANDAKVHPDSAWVLRGDRNITYSDIMPKDVKISEGEWWQSNIGSETQVSFSQKEGHELGLKLGDTITVNVLGHELTAKVTNFRDVDWNSFNMNFVMIFSPQILKNAPHVWLATFKNGSKQNLDEASFMREISHRFPSITVVPVHQVLSDASKLINQISTAIRASSSIALLASILVLAGALSASNRARAHDAVILKMLGATRLTLMKAYIYEYALLGLITATFAFIFGSLAGCAIAHYKMEILSPHLMWSTGFTVIITSLILSIGFGLIGTWKILSEKPSRFLKDL